MKRSISLSRSTPSSQLHPLPQVPLAYRHRAGRQYPGVPTSGNITVIAKKVKTPGPTSSCTSSSTSGVTPHDSDTFQLPASSSSSELSARWFLLLLFAPLLFANRDMARTTTLNALRQYVCRPKFWRRPQRSCSVGAAKVVSHVCDSACSVVRRRQGLGPSGWRRARISSPQAAIDPRRTLVGVKVLPSSAVSPPSCYLP